MYPYVQEKNNKFLIYHGSNRGLGKHRIFLIGRDNEWDKDTPGSVEKNASGSPWWERMLFELGNLSL